LRLTAYKRVATGNQQLAVRLDSDTVSGVAQICRERGIERSVSVQPSESNSRLSSNRCELTTNEDSAVGLQRQRLHGVVDYIGDKTRIDTSIKVEACNLFAWHTKHVSENACDQNLAIRLSGRCLDKRTIDGEIETRIESTVRVESRHEVAVLSS